MVFRLYISNLFYPSHNVSMVDSQCTQNFFVRETHVKMKSCSCVKFNHTRVSTSFGFIYEKLSSYIYYIIKWRPPEKLNGGRQIT